MRIEWPTVGMILLCYAVWFAAGLMLWPAWPLAALAIMAVMSALHSSLQHEVLHGHPTRSARINEAMIAQLPLSPFYPYRRFRTLHLRHHNDDRLTDPYDDPESYYLDGRNFAELPAALRFLLQVNNTLAGRLVIGPALMVGGFLGSEWKLIRAGNRSVIVAWLLHLAGLCVLALVLQTVFAMPFWLYVVTSGYAGMSLISVRTFCEHQAADTPEHRTIIVERSPLAVLFLYNNLHLVHHKLPGLPWYRIPAHWAERREEWLAMNNHYAFPGYWAIARRYGLRRKEPVVHPAYPVPAGQLPDKPRDGSDLSGTHAPQGA